MDEITIDVNALFDKASFDSTSNDWIITFSDSVSILISGFWRLLSNGGIASIWLLTLAHTYRVKHYSFFDDSFYLLGDPRPVPEPKDLNKKADPSHIYM